MKRKNGGNCFYEIHLQHKRVKQCLQQRYESCKHKGNYSYY